MPVHLFKQRDKDCVGAFAVTAVVDVFIAVAVTVFAGFGGGIGIWIAVRISGASAISGGIIVAATNRLVAEKICDWRLSRKLT